MLTGCFRMPHVSPAQAFGRKYLQLLSLCILAAFAGVALAPRARAQSVDTAILGTVTDPSGAVIPNAAITVSSPSTGASKTVHTGANGRYFLNFLLPGTYDVAAAATGFQKSVRSGVVVAVSQEARVNLVLTIGQASQTVQVTAAAPLLNTVSGALSAVVSPTETVNLPLNGRNFAQLAVLTPGVHASASTTSGSFSVNGLEGQYEQVTLDGGDITDNRANTVFLLPSIDAIQEFRVNTTNYSAQYGDNAGAVVNVQLKSGTNRFHGTLYEFNRNNVFDARGYFQSPTAPASPLRRNQFGAILGGPIRKNHAFFLVGYSGDRELSASPAQSETFTPQQLSGDFGYLLPKVQLINPATDQPIPGNDISSMINPGALSIAKTYMPTPNCNGQVSDQINYCGQSVNYVHSNQVLGRFDEQIGNNSHFSADYVGNYGHFPSNPLNPFFPVRYDIRAQSFTARFVHTYSPTLTNETLFSADYGTINQESPRSAQGFSIHQTLGIIGFDTQGGPGGPAVPQQFQGFPQLNVNGMVGMGDSDSGQALDLSRTYQFADNASITNGNNSFKFGGELRRVIDNADTSNQSWGNETFDGAMSGNAAADFLLGIPHTTLSPEGIPLNGIRQWRSALYLEDDWTVSSRLTLNLGVRWDWTQLPTDVSGVSRTLRFDLPGGPVLFPAPGMVQPLYIHPANPIEPRLGFAYQIDSADVLRGGFGMFDAEAKFDNINILQLNPPLHASINSINPNPNVGPPTATLQNPIAPANLVNPIYDVVSEPPDQKKIDPYTSDWNLTYQRQVSRNSMFQIGYVGITAIHLNTSDLGWNSPQPAAGPIQPRRPYPQWGVVRMIETNGWSKYNALQSSFRYQFAHGFTATAQYTWSHLINNIQGSTNGARALEQNPREEGGPSEVGNAASDVPQDFTVGYVWDLPVGAGLHGFMGYLVHNWSTSGLITFSSGSPLLIGESGDPQNTDNPGERPNLVAGQDIVLPNPTPNEWFNKAAFSKSVLSYGNTPRNPAGLYGPGTSTFDLSLTRTFDVPHLESNSVLFRAEFYNAFNTPQFGNPGTTLGTSSFGRITRTSGSEPNRVIQLALKYSF